MNKMIPQFLLAAPCSGSGKTTLSRGLMAALTRRGWRVQPFKCGPDYIDTKFHEAVCGRPSFNLDTFMASHTHVRQLYARHAATAEVCVVEGMMGLFDGYDRFHGSSAEIATLLQLPVILVVDAASAAYSMAALLQGFLHFRADTQIVGVLFNRVGSSRHFSLLQEVCDELQIPCLGYLPKDKALEHHSRYLGLDFSEEVGQDFEDYLVAQMERYVDLPRLLEVTSRPLPVIESQPQIVFKKPMHSVVLKDDEAFSFVYAEHVEILQQWGKVTFLNPFEDAPLPDDTDFLYLPGGYPEKHATALSAATCTAASIRRYIEAGGRALAECGGMIYLSQGIHLEEAPSFIPLCGVLPFAISGLSVHRKLQLGYRQFMYGGRWYRGHEFHYTNFYPDQNCLLFPSVVQVYNARQEPVTTPVFRYKNLLASYTHLYWGEWGAQDFFSNIFFEV